MALRCAFVILGMSTPLVVELISSFAEEFTLVVPMPTEPAVVIRIFSVLLVRMRKSTEFVVPSFEELVALLLPAKLQ